MSAFKEKEEYYRLREIVGIENWHQVGYQGKGLSIFCDDVGGNHAEGVVNILEVILPKAQIYSGRICYHIQYGAVVKSMIMCDTTGEAMPFDDFIEKYRIKLINNSTTGSLGAVISPVGAFMKTRITRYNIIMTGSAGNGYGRPINTNYYGAAIIVTSVQLNDTGSIVNSKCAEGEGIDFSMFYGPMPGTSYSAPFLLGMIGLLLEKYPHLNQQQVYQYLKDHCLTLGSEEVFGHGLPILGQV